MRASGRSGVSLFNRRDQTALTAFATEQVNAALAGDGASRPPAASSPDDPGWVMVSAMAEQIFTDVRRACTVGDLGSVSGRIAADLAAALGRQQDTMAAQGQRRVTRIDSVTARPLGGQAPSAEDRTMVIRYAVTGGLGNAVLGDDLDAQLAVLPSRTWFEIWRLDRPAGAPPVEPAATCTNCGAPGNGLTTCRYCGTQLCQVPSDFAVGSIEWLA